MAFPHSSSVTKTVVKCHSAPQRGSIPPSSLAAAPIPRASVRGAKLHSSPYALQAQSRKKLSTHRQSLTICAIAVGDKIPDGNLSYFDADGNMQQVSVQEMCAGKKVVLFAVPGAFTPTCSLKHLPGFIEKADEIKSKGVETIGCVAVNDAFVMKAWGESVGADGKVTMLADGSAIFTTALGVELDLNDKGLGMRSRRYSMLVDDGVVTMLNLEEGGAFTVSGAEDVLNAL
ncbi:peroxiredoxin-5-like protein [Cymbomonas tetramitiformis]|uniref:Glutaredoxin-dependent peroxiredoxin n=1 Tax=Cymbomonas tetramitiformis TaxID=36881 RepID=A0AAE0H4A9_9CHLO|nr:peroxiredoxin-5-like protein [Cymbomonas tetramitiformis]